MADVKLEILLAVMSSLYGRNLPYKYFLNSNSGFTILCLIHYHIPSPLPKCSSKSYFL